MECPPLEDIAAFIDDTLSPEERARITEHLARCESCYEVFSGAVHFQTATAGDTGRRGVLRFPLGNAILKGLLAAASVVLVAGIGFFTWRQFLAPPKITLAGVIDPIEKKAGISNLLYQEDVPRGSGGSSDLDWDRPAFLAGVHLVDLRLSVEAREVKVASSHLQNLGDALNDMPGFGNLGDRCQTAYLSLEDAAALEPLERFAQELPSLEKEIEQSLSEDPSFSFGLWTEAGRLAAVTKSKKFFDTRNNRRFLSSLLKEPPGTGDEALETVPDSLERIDEAWKQRDYETLGQHFEKIIKTYEKASSDLDDLYPSTE
jgi:hypothetical protein